MAGGARPPRNSNTRYQPRCICMSRCNLTLGFRGWAQADRKEAGRLLHALREKGWLSAEISGHAPASDGVDGECCIETLYTTQ